MRTSDHLTVGRAYTRAELRDMFSIKDATINTGVFRPRGHESVWLFVTEDKTPDRTQYRDHLIGDTLEWDGQPSGRTDRWIIDHERLGLELLLFYRARKYQFAGAGFEYFGPVMYAAHSGGNPTHFVLRMQAG